MKMGIKVVIVIIAIWLSSALAISVGLYCTHDIRCLFFLLVPALMKIRIIDKKEVEDGNDGN